MNPEIASDKQSIVDVLCKDSLGNRYIAEMQLARDKGFEKRAQLYAAKAYSRQSGNYIDFKTVFFIAISNSTLFPSDVFYISTHNIRDIKTNGHYLKDFQFVFIELPKFTKSKVEQLETTVERWSFFFKYAEETTDEDLRKIAEKSPIIKLAYDELDKFHWNEKDLVAYEERVMDLQKEAAILEQKLDDAKQEGRQEGILIGHQKKVKLKLQKVYLKLSFPLILFLKQLVLQMMKLNNSTNALVISAAGYKLLDHLNKFQVYCLFSLAFDFLTDSHCLKVYLYKNISYTFSKRHLIQYYH